MRIVSFLSACFLLLSVSQAMAFDVYNAMFYRGMPPNFDEQLGTKKACVLYEHRVYGSDTGYIIDRNVMRTAAQEFGSQNCSIMAIDIERLYAGNAYAGSYCPQGARECYLNIWRMRDAYNEFKRNTSPEIPVGWYSMPPVINAWAMQRGPQHPWYIATQRQREAIQPVINRVDYMSPVYYYVVDPDDQANNRENFRLWLGTTTNMTAEARRLGALNGRSDVPVIAWISPTFEAQAGQGGSYVSGRVWRETLEHLRSLDVSVIIWDGWDGVADAPKPWPPRNSDGTVADWWLETLNFMGRPVPQQQQPSQKGATYAPATKVNDSVKTDNAAAVQKETE